MHLFSIDVLPIIIKINFNITDEQQETFILSLLNRVYDFFKGRGPGLRGGVYPKKFKKIKYKFNIKINNAQLLISFLQQIKKEIKKENNSFPILCKIEIYKIKQYQLDNILKIQLDNINQIDY
jgi:hypothetical protein